MGHMRDSIGRQNSTIYEVQKIIMQGERRSKNARDCNQWYHSKSHVRIVHVISMKQSGNCLHVLWDNIL